MLDRRGIVSITETFLDASISNVVLTVYTLISRRDRDDGRLGGGIALFAHKRVAPHLVHVGTSKSFERTWHVFHSDQGAISICLWYRPPACGEVASVHAFDDELTTYGGECEYSITVGDMNAHNIEWLPYSSYNSRITSVAVMDWSNVFNSLRVTNICWSWFSVIAVTN